MDDSPCHRWCLCKGCAGTGVEFATAGGDSRERRNSIADEAAEPDSAVLDATPNILVNPASVVNGSFGDCPTIVHTADKPA